MSARATWRLEAMGFREVYRYHPGKLDWISSGLPVEGEWADIPKIGDAARRDVPVCRLTDTVAQARTLAESKAWDVCVVVNSEKVVLGLLDGRALAAGDETPVEEAMNPGPTTYRPHLFVSDAAEYMRRQDLPRVLVTDSDGRLIGALRLADAEEIAQRKHERQAESKARGPYRR